MRRRCRQARGRRCCCSDGRRLSVLSATNSQSAQAAAHGGAGVALLPEIVARAIGGLVPVTLGESPPARVLWMLMRPDVARLARVRVVAESLISLFEK